MVTPQSQLLGSHHDEAAYRAKEQLPFRGRGSCTRPVVRYRDPFRPAQAADRESVWIDDREPVVGARPDLPARVLEQLIDTLAGEPLRRAEPDEVWLAVVVPTIQHTDTSAEGAHPESTAAVGQQGRDVTRPQRIRIGRIGKNALHGVGGQIETIEAVLRADPQGARRPAVDARDPLVGEPLDVRARDTGIGAQIQCPQTIEPTDPQHAVFQVQSPDCGARIMRRHG